MKNLNHIEAKNLIDWYNNIVANKDPGNDKENLISITNKIEERYNAYIKEFEKKDLINITDSIYPKNHKELLSCYKSEGTVLITLKKQIRDAQPKEIKRTCQYCGVYRPKSMDHYLPISDFPEFSVLAINLIPCCKDCNGKKLNYWKENGVRGILNFYIDNIPNTQFLFASVELKNNVPDIKFFIENIDNKIDGSLFKIITNHFTRLELTALYNDEAKDELTEIIRILKTYVDNPTIIKLNEKILNDAMQLQSQFGINNWKAILRQSLANSNEFLNYLINLKEPLLEK